MIPPRPEIIFVAIGIVSIAAGLPLAGRRIRPNHWYGVRIRETFGDEHIWYEVNAQAGRDLVVLGVVDLVVALALPTGLPPARYAGWAGALFGAGALIVLIRSVALARRLWRERGSNPGPGEPR